MNNFENRRYFALDGLRGLAALYVLFFHVTWLNHFSQSTLVRNGYLAVDLFFILSGFIIAASYRQRLNSFADGMTFLRRRFFRVYPMHAFVLLAMTALECLKVVAWKAGAPVDQVPFSQGYGAGYLVLNALFVQGFGFADRTSWNVPSWSVSAEFLAYILFAILTAVGFFRHRALIFIAALGACAGYFALSCSFNTLDLTYRFGIFRCLAGFAIGVAIYELKLRGGLKRLDSLSFAATSTIEIAAMAATIFVLSVVTDQWSALIVPAFAVLILVFQKDGGLISQLLARDWPQAMGRLSYSFYLVHVPIRIVASSILVKLGTPAIRNAGDQQILQVPLWLGDLMIIAFIAIALLISSVTFRVVEEPARMFGRSWRKREMASGVGQI